MKITVHVNGLIFTSKVTDEMTPEEAKEAFFKDFEKMEKFTVKTKDGSFILFGKTALQNAVLVFSED